MCESILFRDTKKVENENISIPIHTLIINVNNLEWFSSISFPLFIQMPTGVGAGRAGSCLCLFFTEIECNCTHFSSPWLYVRVIPTMDQSLLFWFLYTYTQLYIFEIMPFWQGCLFFHLPSDSKCGFILADHWFESLSLTHRASITPGRLRFVTLAEWVVYQACWQSWGVTACCLWSSFVP